MASGNSFVNVSDLAFGGSGGSVLSGTGSGGAGGAAFSAATGQNPGTNSVSVRSDATGGVGGQRAGTGTIGSTGGSAQASAVGSGGGSTSANATATGGTGSGGSFNGAARADASATGTSAIGTSGSATAAAHSAGGLVRAVDSNATAPLPGPGTGSAQAAARAAVSQPAPAVADASGKEALAFATGLPNAADVTTVLAGNPNATATFSASGTQALGLMHMGGGYAGNANGASRTSTATVDFNLDVTKVATKQFLTFAFLDPAVSGSGFDSLRFRVNREFAATAQLDMTFLAAADAMTFFNDHMVSVGNWTGVSADNILDIQIIFDVTSNDAGAAFNTNFLVGNATPITAAIPEPSTYVLFAFGLLGMAVITRRRRHALK